MTIGFIVMGVAGFGWGTLSDRIGARPVVLIAAVLLGGGLLLASQARDLIVFQFAYGGLVGASGGAFFAPIMADHARLVRQEPQPRRVAGVARRRRRADGDEPARQPISSATYRLARRHVLMIAIGAVPSHPRLPAHPPRAGRRRWRRPRAASAAPTPSQRSLGLRRAAHAAVHRARGDVLSLLRRPFRPDLPHRQLRHDLRRIGARRRTGIYSVEGVAGLFGRLVFGVLADRIGVRKVIVGGLALQAVGIYLYIYVTRDAAFLHAGLVLGLAYGGVMPLYSVLAREYFSARVMGTVLGAATMTSSIGMAFGPVGGGWLYDTFGTYHWLYIASAAVGLAAAAMARSGLPAGQGLRRSAGVRCAQAFIARRLEEYLAPVAAVARRDRPCDSGSLRSSHMRPCRSHRLRC
jgi:MFS family permease